MEIKFEFTSEHFYDYKRAQEEKKKAYNEWSRAMVNDDGYTITIKKVMEKLQVSRNWVVTRLCPNVDYIKLPASRLSELELDPYGQILFSKQKLVDYLMSIAKFTRQTIVIDLKKELAGDEFLLLENDSSIVRFDSNTRHIYGLRSERLLSLIAADYDNVNERNRAKYEEVEVPAFPFWDLYFYTSKGFKNPETAYRYFFRRGMIKITLLGKSLFVCDNLDDIEYPITIEYKKYAGGLPN